MIAVTLAIELFLMTCIGIFTAKMKIVPDTFAGHLTNFLMKVALPCLIFVSINTNEFSFDLLRNCFFALIAGLVVMLLFLLIGHIFYLIMGKSGVGRVMRYGLTFPHYSFMGIPIMDALFGTTGNLYYVMFLVPVRILYYTLSPRLLGPSGGKEKKSVAETLKTIFNPCMCAVIIGVLFWVFGWKFPTVIQYCVDSLNKICSPLGLLLCGLVLGRNQIRQLINPRFFRLPLARTILMPLIFLILTRPLKSLGMDPVLCDMIVIYAALPCASLTAAYALQYEPEQDVQFEAAGSVFIATLLSTFTIPMWYAILTTFFS